MRSRPDTAHWHLGVLMELCARPVTLAAALRYASLERDAHTLQPKEVDMYRLCRRVYVLTRLQHRQGGCGGGVSDHRCGAGYEVDDAPQHRATCDCLQVGGL
jgi:hypothetical protein